MLRKYIGHAQVLIFSVPTIIVFCRTTLLNAFSYIAFCIFLSAIISTSIYKYLHIDIIQFERYRDDIGDVKFKRKIILLCVSLSITIILSAVFNFYLNISHLF